MATPIYNPEPTNQAQPPSQEAGVKFTHYGYPGDSTPDTNSSNGIGDRDNRLTGGYSVALTQAERYARFGVTGKSTGKELVHQGKIYRDDDTAPESDRRVDLYDPTSKAIDSGGGRPAYLPPSIAIATPDQLAKFHQYQQNGGDTTQFSPRDMLAFRLAEDPNYLLKPENVSVFNDMVVKPTDEANGGIVQQAGNAAAAVPAMIVKAYQGLDAWQNELQNSAYDGMKYWLNKVTGKQDAGTVANVAQQQTDMATGTVKGVTDAVDMLDGVGASLQILPGAIARPFLDAKGKEGVDNARAQILQDHMRLQTQLAGGVKATQQVVANGYKAVGLADLGNQIEKTTPNPGVQDTQAFLANPLNFIPGAAGGEAARGLVGAGKAAEAVTALRPTFIEKGLETAEANSEAITKASAYKSAMAMPPSGLPKVGNLPDGVPPTAPSDIKQVITKLAPDARAAAQDAAQKSQDSTAAMNTITQSMNSGGGISKWVGQNMQNLGSGVSALGKGLAVATDLPAKFATKILGGNEMLGNLLGNELLDIGFGTSSEAAGKGAAEGWGEALALRLAPHPMQGVGEALNLMGKELTYGQTTLPYARRVAYQLDLAGHPVGASIARALDNSLLYQAVPAIKGTITGALVGAAQGALSQPQNPIAGGVQGGALGSIMGMAGGGLGQVLKYSTPQEVMALSRGDWNRYRSMLPTPEKANFDKLSGGDQIALSQFAHQFPGLKVNYQHLGPNAVAGSHAIENGRSVVNLNLDQPGSAIKGTLAHELAHGVASNGQLPKIYARLLGDPANGTVGTYTELGSDGKPVGVDPESGFYKTNQTFQNLKNDYVTGLNRSGIKTDGLTDRDIAREIYAEHGADYYLSGQHVLDASSAYDPKFYQSRNSFKTALMKLGYAFDRGGNVVQGTGLFNNLQRDSALDKLTQSYTQSRRVSQMVSGDEEPAERIFDAKNPDHWKANNAETWLDSAPQLMRDKDGNVMKDKNGTPFLRPQGEVRSYAAQMANDMHDWISNLPEDKRNDLGFQKVAGTKDTWFGRYLPDELLDHLASRNQYNFKQVDNMRDLSKILSDGNQNGREVNFFYHKATNNGKYGQFSGASYNAVPYGFEIGKSGNVNVRAVNFGRLGDNYLAVRDKLLPYQGQKVRLRDVWDTPVAFMNDVHSMFAAHQRGESGATDIGAPKRDLINGLLKLGTNQSETNPFAATVPSGAKHIFTSFRVDRINRLTPTDTVRPFSGESQYQQYIKPNYLPAARMQAQWGDANVPADESKIPEMFSNSYLTKPQKQKLAQYIQSGHVADLGDKLAEEYKNNWSQDPEVMAGKGWYKRMTPLLKHFFGDDAELFTNLLAATSPRQKPTQNFKDALQAYTRYKLGHFDDIIKKYKETGKIEDWMKPRQLNDAKMSLNSDAVLKVLSGKWKSSGPKTPNFNTNLLGTGHEATIDIWAHRTLSRLAGWKGKVSNSAIDNLEFALGQHAFRHAADKLGIDPDDLQAVAWYGEQKLYGEKAESYDAPMQELVQKGNPFSESAKTKGAQTPQQLAYQYANTK